MGQRRHNAWFTVQWSVDAQGQGVVERWLYPAGHTDADVDIMRRVVDAIPRVVSASEATTDYIEKPPPGPSAWFRS